jgi:hypothetical protein
VDKASWWNEKGKRYRVPGSDTWRLLPLPSPRTILALLPLEEGEVCLEESGATPRAHYEKDLPMSSPAEPFVRDDYFEPIPNEITSHYLPVSGTLPPRLTGVYLRNGDGRIIVDGIRTNRFPSAITADPPLLYRWEIALTRGVVTEGAMCHLAVEFPRVDERRNGRPCRSRRTSATATCPASPCSSRGLRTPPRMTGGCSHSARTASWIVATSSSSTRTRSAAIRWPPCSYPNACPSVSTGAG